MCYNQLDLLQTEVVFFHGLFQPVFHIRVSGSLLRALPTHAYGQGAEYPSVDLFFSFLRLGRACLGVAPLSGDPGLLLWRPSHLVRESFPADGGGESEGKEDLPGRHGGCLPGTSGSLQVYGLFGKHGDGDLWPGESPSRGGAPHRYFLLHLPAYLLRHRRVSQRNASPAQLRQAPSVRRPVSPVHRRPHRPLRRRSAGIEPPNRQPGRGVAGDAPLHRGSGEKGRAGQHLRHGGG